MLKHIALLGALMFSLTSFAQFQNSVTQPIVDRPFTIPPARAIFFKFILPPSATNVTVWGRFEASGGAGNDVEVYIFDEDGFVNWENGHRVRAYYRSGRLTQANVEANLPPGKGTYYLVFSNRFSLVANKAVMTEINLTYNQ